MSKFTELHPEAEVWDQRYCDGDCVMLCPEEKPCGMCEALTPWASVSFEWHYCGPECLNQMWAGLNEACSQVEREKEEVFQRLADHDSC